MTVPRRLSADDRGQVTVELLGITPLILVVLVALWQFVLVGYTYTLAGNAADEGARTAAVGGDVQAAVRQDLPQAWADGASSDASFSGAVATVAVHLKVPVLFPGGLDFPFTVTGTAGAAQEQPR